MVGELGGKLVVGELGELGGKLVNSFFYFLGIMFFPSLYIYSLFCIHDIEENSLFSLKFFMVSERLSI